MKRLLMAAVAMAAWCAIAEVPTQAEFTAAGKVIADLMEPQMAAMKSGKKKSAEVADYAMSLVGESETAAAKFLLARRAYGLYMRGGAYDKAVEAIGEMRAAVPDMPNERMLKAVLPDARNISEKKAPAVHAIVADLKGKVRSQNEIAKLEAALKKAKVSERESIHRQLGERYAVMDDWKKGLEHFAKSGDDVATMAAAEEDGKADAGKLAGFWWDYSENPTVKKSVATAVRQHAVAIYQKGLDDGTISGLNKKLAEQRVADGAMVASVSVAVAPKPRIPNGLTHRWSFNGNCKDSVGMMDGILMGSGKFENGQCILDQGRIVLNDASTSCNGDFTIEIWTTENKYSHGCRAFMLLTRENRHMFGWATGNDKRDQGFFHAGGYAMTTRKSAGKSDCRGFELGKETYIAMTCKKSNDKCQISAYMFDCERRVLKCFTTLMDWPFPHNVSDFLLGTDNDVRKHGADSFSSFNECRIWKRCLSKSEIERSAKAGPDKLVL